MLIARVGWDVIRDLAIYDCDSRQAIAVQVQIVVLKSMPQIENAIVQQAIEGRSFGKLHQEGNVAIRFEKNFVQPFYIDH